MKSFFQQYQKHSLKKQLQILVPAFVLALGLNFVLFTEWGHRLSSSIVDYGEVASSDVSVLVDPEEWVWSVRVHRSIPKDVESIHFTLLYDDEAVLLSDFSSANGQLIKITDTVPLSVSV